MEENNVKLDSLGGGDSADTPSKEIGLSKEEYLKIGIYIDAPVTRREKLFYGMGAFYDGGGASIAAVIMLAFFDVGIGLGALAAGLIIMLAKIWDAISDPLCGAISDNVRSRIGRRRPFFILGGVLLFPALAFVFAPIESWGYAVKLVSAIFAYLFYCTVSTISQVPYMSFASEISADFRERDKANTVKLLFTMSGAAISYLVPTIFFEKFTVTHEISAVAFWLIMTFVFGAFFGIPLILAGVFAREKVPFDVNVKSRFSIKDYSKALKVKTFRYHIGMYISAFMCMDIISALVIYYVNVCLRGMVVPPISIGSLTLMEGGSMSATFVIAPLMVMVAIMLPIIYKMMNKKTKQFAFRMFLPLYIIGGIAMVCLPVTAPFWIVPILAMIMGAGFAGAQIMPWIIFPDTIDVAELKFGTRDAGLFSGVMTFMRKFVSALAVFLCSVALALSKDGEKSFATLFESNTGDKWLAYGDTSNVVIRVIMGCSVVLLISLAIFYSFRYSIDHKKLDRIKYFNEMHAEGRDNELTEEEVKEKEDWIKKLV